MKFGEDKTPGIIFLFFGALSGFALILIIKDTFSNLNLRYFSEVDLLPLVSWTLLTLSLFSGGWVRLFYKINTQVEELDVKLVKRHALLRNGVDLLVLIAVVGWMASIACPGISPTIGSRATDRAIFGDAKASVDIVRWVLNENTSDLNKKKYPIGELNFDEIRGLFAQDNLPTSEMEARWVKDSFSYQSKNGLFYTISVRVNSHYQDTVIGTPSGISPNAYPH